MARLLRSQPPKPHVPGPIAAPGGPVVPGQTVVLWKDKEHRARRGAPKPHLAQPIVAPGGPVVPGATTCYQTAPRKRPTVGRWWPKPHLPGPIVAPGGPVVPGATINLNNQNRKARPERRGAPKPHLPGAIVAPGGPVVPGQTVVYTTPPRRWLRRPQKPNLAGPVLTAPSAPPVGPGTFIYNALKRVVLRRGVPQPHVPGPVVAPGGPVVPGQTVVLNQANREGRTFKRGAPQPHVPPAIVGAPVVLPPVNPGTFVQVTPPRRWWRNPPKPHLTGPVVAPGGPVIAAQTLVLNVMNRLGRTFKRGAPKPHLPPALIPLPPPGPPTFIPTEFAARPPIPYWTAASPQDWWNAGAPASSRWELGVPSGAWSATQALLEPAGALTGEPFGAGLFGAGLFGLGVEEIATDGADVDNAAPGWQTGEPRS